MTNLTVFAKGTYGRIYFLRIIKLKNLHTNNLQLRSN